MSIFINKNYINMEITNKNTFTDEKVYYEKERGLVYIGKSCYKIDDLEKVVMIGKAKDLNESLNYRVRNFNNKVNG